MDEENSDELKLDSLDDDCLECIFCKINNDLKTQVQISKVCQRFREICARIWRRNPSYQCLCLEEWTLYQLTPDELGYFVNILRDTIRVIHLNEYFLHDFLKAIRTMNIVSFPNVHTFREDNIMDLFARDIDIQNVDMDIENLAKLLPNVKILKLTQSLTGRYLKVFTQLQELHLYNDYEKDYELKNQYLKEVLENLTQLRVLDIRSYEMSNLDIFSIDRCQQLQVLKLNLNVLKPVLEKVLSLPQLKTLTVLLDNVIDVSRIDNVDSYDYKIYETAEFYYILEHKAERIRGLAVDNYYMPLAPSWDAHLEIFKYNKLQKFAFCNYEHDDAMLVKYGEMHELRLLCCRNWPQLTNETLLRLVESCPMLEHLDITYCKRLDVSFLEAVYRLLKRLKRKPNKILNIYYSMSGIDYNIEQHPSFAEWKTFIRLSTELPQNSDGGLSYVERGFEFDFE